ncbi:MAG: hypothetical protein U0V02_05580 [Anaerolineales bacterium]
MDDTTNTSWVQIQRLDGLIGWCSEFPCCTRQRTPHFNSPESIPGGVTYTSEDITTHANVIHVMAIDLQTANLEFLVTPSPNTSNVLCSRITSKFLKNSNCMSLSMAAITATWFIHRPVNLLREWRHSGQYLIMRLLAEKVYSPQKTAQPTIYIGQRDQININKQDGAAFARSVKSRDCAGAGRDWSENLAANAANPRTAIGLSRNARWLT